MTLLSSSLPFLSVAPMMDWTDRHCRFFHRVLSPEAELYTEMITADAIIHGDRERLLFGHHIETGDGRVTLQLGGNSPAKLSCAIRYAEPYGYGGYNLNVGCPSGRVQSGCFGAALMAEPHLVRDCVAAMQDASDGRPVSVKCRLGIDDMDTGQGLDDFVGIVAETGITHFIIHARKAWLKGLSPKENRTIPPLDYSRVARLRDDFAHLTISLNGGIGTLEDAVRLKNEFPSIMIGRAAYHTPYILAELSSQFYAHAPISRVE